MGTSSVQANVEESVRALHRVMLLLTLLNVDSKCRNIVDHVVAELDERVSWRRFGKCISDHVFGIAGDEFEGVPMLILQEAQASSVMPGTIERLELLSSHDPTRSVVLVDGYWLVE